MLSRPYGFRSICSQTAVESYSVPSMAPKKGSVRKLTPSMLRMAVAVVMCVILRVGLDVAAMAAVRAKVGDVNF